MIEQRKTYDELLGVDGAILAEDKASVIVALKLSRVWLRRNRALLEALIKASEEQPTSERMP